MSENAVTYNTKTGPEHTDITTLETALVSHLLNDPDLYKANMALFQREMFSQGTKGKKVFEALKKVIDSGEIPDFINISNSSGLSIETAIYYFNAIDYRYEFKNTVQKVIEYQLTNNLINYATALIQNLSRGNNVVTEINNLKQFIENNELTPIKRISNMQENINHLLQSIESRENGEITGLKTGIKSLDEHTGGLQPSDLFVIAGETSQGKTSLALTIAYNSAIKNAARIAVFSLEMSVQQLTARLTSMETRISSKKILFYPLNSIDKDRIKTMIHLPTSAIFIDDCTNSSIEYILSGIRLAHMQFKIQVAIVDYLQLIKDQSKRNEETEISSNTRRLKNLAKELNITIILLSQLSRDKANPKPTLSRLRGSGQIEEASDIVGLIWRPETYGINTYEDDTLPNTFNSAEFIIAKGRNYGITRMYLEYEAKITYFSNMSYGTDKATKDDLPF